MCGPYPDYTQITGNSSAPWINPNKWSHDPSLAQTVYANSPGNWQVSEHTTGTESGGVLTFPNVGWNMQGAIDSETSISSSYTVRIPANPSDAIGWAAYDLWFNNWADEVLIQTEITATPAYACTPKAIVQFGDTKFDLCIFGSERVWRTESNHLTHIENILAMLMWLERHGYLPSATTWTAGSFGFEVTNTFNRTWFFKVLGFTWHSQ